MWRPDPSAACASRRPRVPSRRRPARAGVRAGTRRWCRPARPCRRARRLRSTCCRPSCARPSTALRSPEPRYSITWPVPPLTPMRPMIASTRSLAVMPGPRRPVDVDRHRARPALQQALRREHVPDLGGPDAEGERAECAVGAGVAVAADDGRPGWVSAELRADDVHDAAPVVLHPEQLDAELRAVARELTHLPCGRFDRDRHATGDLRRVRRGRVIHGRQRPVRAAQPQTACPQHVEGLRRGDLVHQVQIDVQHRRRSRPSRARRRAGPRPCRRACAVRVFTRARSSDRDRPGGRDPLLAPGTGDGVARRLDLVDDVEESSHGRLHDVRGDARCRGMSVRGTRP